jgi:hypothetical protein
MNGGKDQKRGAFHVLVAMEKYVPSQPIRRLIPLFLRGSLVLRFLWLACAVPGSEYRNLVLNHKNPHTALLARLGGRRANSPCGSELRFTIIRRHANCGHRRIERRTETGERAMLAAIPCVPLPMTMMRIAR